MDYVVQDGELPQDTIFNIQWHLSHHGLDLTWDEASRAYRDLIHLHNVGLDGTDIPLTLSLETSAASNSDAEGDSMDWAPLASNLDSPLVTENPSPDLPLLALEPIASSDLLRIKGRLGRHEVRVLIDGGAKGNFVSLAVVKAAGLRTQDDSSYVVTTADGRKLPASIAPDCTLRIKDYKISLDLLATPIAHDVILGKAWLEKVNPIIDWKNNEVTFHDEDGRMHAWTAFDDLSGDLDDLPLSATQLKRIMRSPETRAWMCVLTDIDEFRQSVDQGHGWKTWLSTQSARGS